MIKTLAFASLALATIGIYMNSRTYKYFKFEEFADKISGANKTNIKLIKMLDKARELAGVPFVITSGYRDANHPETIDNPTSSHAKGLAVDIAVNDSNRDIIQKSLREVGFNRIGLANSFIHADIDTDKTQFVTWFYDNRPILYNNSELVYYV